MDAGENASRLLGQTILEFDAVREPQLAGPYYIATASFALWRGDVADASRSVDRAGRPCARPRSGCSPRGWPRWSPRSTPPPRSRPARTASSLRWPPPASARTRWSRRRAGWSGPRAPRRRPARASVAEASLATARAFQRRLEGEDSGTIWRHVAQGWAALDAPYDVALARWRQAEATLAAATGRSGRAKAQAPLLEAVELGLRLGAKPLLRELRELAGRARIALPPEVDAALDGGPAVAEEGPDWREGTETMASRAAQAISATAGPTSSVRSPAIHRAPPSAPTRSGSAGASEKSSAWSPRARTNREIGERLFISQKTGRCPRREHPRQARGLRSGRGRRGRDQAGPDRAPLTGSGVVAPTSGA